MLFWFFITIFGTGTFVVFEQHILFGMAMIAIGFAGMFGCAWRYLKDPISERVIFHRYWPMIIMAILMLLTWVGVAVGYYGRNSASDIPEFDGSNADLVLGWGQDTTGACDMNVNGKLLLNRQSGYKLAIGCFIYDGKEDILDAPYIQVSNLYDIKDGVIAMRSSYQPYFLEYYKQMHPTGTEIALFNVPNGVQPTQFTTLRQARSLGVKIPYIKIVRPGE